MGESAYTDPAGVRPVSNAATGICRGGKQHVAALLEARRCSLPALSRLGTMTILEDATVPRPRLAEMVDRIDAIAHAHDVPVATFGHAGDGNLHPTIVVDRWFPSSKVCSACGAVRDGMPLAVREWVCRCGATHDRDVNAARNIRAAGLAVLACGDGVRPARAEAHAGSRR